MKKENIVECLNFYRDYLRKNNKFFALRKVYSNLRVSLLKYRMLQRNHSKLAIIGCGRSGTKYVSKLFNSIGIKIGHERLSKHGIASWTLVPETNVEVWGPSFKKISKINLPMVHQTRDPLKVISSVKTVFSDQVTWNFISKFIPIKNEETITLKAMKYWYYWNLMAEKKALFTYQVEEIDKHIYKLIEIGRFNIKLNNRLLLSSISKKVNSRIHSDLSWNDIQEEDDRLSQRIYDLSLRYGYKY